MWTRKSQEWQRELEEIRRETIRHEKASADYSVTGSKILELAKSAHNLFTRQDSDEHARLLKILLSNCTFDRGSLCPTYSKPFDLFVAGNESGDWRREWDSSTFAPSVLRRISSRQRAIRRSPACEGTRAEADGGESGIRTHGRVSPTHAFQACSFNHSDISPLIESTTCEQSEANYRTRLRSSY